MANLKQYLVVQDGTRFIDIARLREFAVHEQEFETDSMPKCWQVIGQYSAKESVILAEFKDEATANCVLQRLRTFIINEDINDYVFPDNDGEQRRKRW